MITSRGARTCATASAVIATATLLTGCSGSGYDSTYGVSASPRVVRSGPIPKGGGTYKVGRPYKVAGRWYVPREDHAYDHTGIASWYGDDFHGRKTANGEIYNMNALSAAHPTLPLPSYVYVTNVENGRTLLLRVNDRGPYAANRIIDLSRSAARMLGLERQGLGRVRVRYAGRAPLNGDDRHEREYAAQSSPSQSWDRMSAGVYDNGPRQSYRREYSNDSYSGWSPDRYRQAETLR